MYSQTSFIVDRGPTLFINNACVVHGFIVIKFICHLFYQNKTSATCEVSVFRKFFLQILCYESYPDQGLLSRGGGGHIFVSKAQWCRKFIKIDCSLIWNFHRMCLINQSSNYANFMEKDVFFFFFPCWQSKYALSA